jgi:putative tricarboxylic transport membrane protein
VLISGFSAIILYQAFTGMARRSVAELWAGTRWTNVALVVASLILFALAFEQLGFIVCILPLLIALMRFVDPVRWRTTLLVSGIASLTVWYVMTKLLLIQLPAGMLWDRLGWL